ncbi:hypothetical protein Tco_0197793, partial [Tanacetum coccineum]
ATTYQTFYSGQRIEFYSLNGISVLQQYGVFCKLYTVYWHLTDLYGVFTSIEYGVVHDKKFDKGTTLTI